MVVIFIIGKSGLTELVFLFKVNLEIEFPIHPVDTMNYPPCLHPNACYSHIRTYGFVLALSFGMASNAISISVLMLH